MLVLPPCEARLEEMLDRRETRFVFRRSVPDTRLSFLQFCFQSASMARSHGLNDFVEDAPSQLLQNAGLSLDISCDTEAVDWSNVVSGQLRSCMYAAAFFVTHQNLILWCFCCCFDGTT